jgi:hypothetical protein
MIFLQSVLISKSIVCLHGNLIFLGGIHSYCLPLRMPPFLKIYILSPSQNKCHLLLTCYYRMWQCGSSLVIRAFFPSVLWCSCTGNHPQEELTKFGYRSKSKVENFKNPTIFWWPARNYICLNMMISEKDSLNSGEFGSFLFTNIVSMSCMGLFFYWWKSHEKHRSACNRSCLIWSHGWKHLAEIMNDHLHWFPLCNLQTEVFFLMFLYQTGLSQNTFTILCQWCLLGLLAAPWPQKSLQLWT